MSAKINKTHCKLLITWSLAVFCAFPITALAQMASGQKAPPPLGTLVDVGGYRIHLYCTGEGTPTVVIVGAGFSFDSGLVQPEAAKFTQVCAYDHSGIGWSDDGPKDSCSLRVSEVHTALKNAGIKGPYVLVGHSLGGLVARVYAGRFPEEVAGMIFVDHAINPMLLSSPGDKPLPPPPPKPSSPSAGPIGKPVGIESDPNFSKLSDRDRELHLWFISQPRTEKSLQAHLGMMPGCVEEANAILKEHDHPLADKPLVDISIQNASPAYINLQTQLLSLSQNSKEMIAEKSSHFVIIDRPDVVVEAIRQAVQSVRNNAKL